MLRLESEVDFSLMLELKINIYTNFNVQRGKIMTWKNSDDIEDDNNAVSFQEKQGLLEITNFINSINNSGLFNNFDLNDFHNEEEDILVEPTLENLPKIANQIKLDFPITYGQRIIDYLMKDDELFLRKLFEIFIKEESIVKKHDFNFNNCVDQAENLSILFIIFKNILFFANQEIIEFLISDEFHEYFFGILECNNNI